MAAQVYRFTDANGEVRLMAEIDPAPGGGYTPPTTREAFSSGGNVSVPGDDSYTLIPFAHQGGDALLGYASATEPSVLVAGIYALCVVVFPPASAVGRMNALFLLDEAGVVGTTTLQATVPLSATAPESIFFFPTYYFAAGMQLELFLQQNSGGPLNAQMDAASYIQRVT